MIVECSYSVGDDYGVMDMQVHVLHCHGIVMLVVIWFDVRRLFLSLGCLLHSLTMVLGCGHVCKIR